MKKRKPSKRIKGQSPVREVVRYILLLVVAVGTFVWLVMSSNYIFIVFSIFAAGLSIFKIITIHLSSMRKVCFMFNAIDCDDYSFKFSDSVADVSSYMLNNSLNRIKEILSNAKIRALEREKYYELIMNSVKTGVVTINDNGNVFQVNNEIMRLFGLQIFTHINQLRVFDPNLTSILRDIKAGDKKQHTLKHERGGVKLSIEASGILYDGKKLRIISINDINSAMDVNEIESWIKLTRVLTHEIMNSLAPITSLSDTLIEINENRSPQITNGLETIRSTSRSLIAFVESYRKFTRIQTPLKSPFEIKTLLERSIHLICTEEFAVVELEVNPPDTMIYADPDLVTQVVVNIIKNAEQAVTARVAEGEEGFTGKIMIDACVAPDERIVLNISNNGGAIPDNLADDIFMPFFTTKEQGSGIGLSVSKQIMHLHGGSIRLTSNTNDKVTFTLIFE